MKFGRKRSLRDLCPRLHLIGDTEICVSGYGHLGNGFEGMLAFAERGETIIALLRLGAAAVIASSPEFERVRDNLPKLSGFAVAIADNPSREYALLLAKEAESSRRPLETEDPAWGRRGVVASSHATIDRNAVLGEGTVVYDGVRIGHNVRIGAGCTVQYNAVVSRNVVIGDDCIIGPGSVIGAMPNWYYSAGERRSDFVAIGTVVVGNGVTVGANCVIDRGLTGVTAIGDGTKIGNLVQVGHEARIGNDVLVIAGTGIAGNTIIEDRATILGQSGIDRGVRIGRNATVAAGSGVSSNVADGETVVGFRAVPQELYSKRQRAYNRLPGVISQLPAYDQSWQIVLDYSGSYERWFRTLLDADVARSLWREVRSILADNSRAATVDEIVLNTRLASDLGCDSLDEIDVYMEISDRIKLTIQEDFSIARGTAGDCLQAAAAALAGECIQKMPALDNKSKFLAVTSQIREARDLGSRLPRQDDPLRFVLLGAIYAMFNEDGRRNELQNADTYRDLYVEVTKQSRPLRSRAAKT